MKRVELKYRSTVRKQKRKGPPVDAEYLAFVRTFSCFHCGLDSEPDRLTQPHHFEASGTGTKCSDYDTVPLCNYCHNHLWHQHRTFPGGTTAEWKEKFRKKARLIQADYQAQGGSLLGANSNED